jgi:hypothetical protein
MKILSSKPVMLVLLFWSSSVFAKPTTFVNNGLKDTTVVTLDVIGKTATGSMVIHHGVEEEDRLATPFSGKVIPTPKGKKGVYLEVVFDGKPPYNIPPGAKRLIWYLKIVERRAHLFIPTYQRNYETRPPSWVVDDDELVPENE